MVLDKPEKPRMLYIDCAEPERALDDPGLAELLAKGWTVQSLGPGFDPRRQVECWGVLMVPPARALLAVAPDPWPMATILPLVVGGVLFMATGAGLLALGMWL